MSKHKLQNLKLTWIGKGDERQLNFLQILFVFSDNLSHKKNPSGIFS